MAPTAVLVAVVVALLAAVLLAAVVIAAASRQTRRQAAAEREATLQAVQAVLSERGDAVVRSAVDTAATVAGEKLGDHLATGSRELGLRSESFEKQVSGMQHEIHRLTDLVGTLQRERAEQHGQVVEGLRDAARSHEQLASTTSQLREALASPQSRGQWGERMADDVLRLAGMIEGVNYRKQTALAGGTVPDLTFFLPDGLLLNMDVKFPLANYLKFLDAGSEVEAAAARKAFLGDVRARVKEITGRDYIDPESTVDCVLLFIPNESIYSFVHQHDPALADHALGHGVVLCSPFTLFAVLGVVRRAVDSFRIERTSDEILRTLGGFEKEWTKFGEQLDKVERQFGTVHKSLEALGGTRRRALERQIDRVDDLRAQRGLEATVVPAEVEDPAALVEPDPVPALRSVSGG